TTSTTPLRLRRLSAPKCSTSPTRPTIVRDTPRLTNASPPAARTSSTIASTSSCVASGAITTTMGSPPVALAGLAQRTKPRALRARGLSSGRFASAQRLAGDRPGTGPVAIPKLELRAHGCSLAHAHRGLHPGAGDAARLLSGQEPAGHERRAVEQADDDE